MILVTGGAGYIGSHTCVELARTGLDFLILDNLCNGTQEAVERVSRLIGREARCFVGDIRDSAVLDQIFSVHPISAVIHFAGLKSVGESIAKPMGYYDNNVVGSMRMVEAMTRAGCKTLVFSSSANVYGHAAKMPVNEDSACDAVNPYGRTKMVVEQMLRDLQVADPAWRIATLRYFNPVGAHASGLLGEDPRGLPDNLMPHIAQVAAGIAPCLSVFGADYDTPDGTGVRDFVHVADLAEGHVAALRYLNGHDNGIVANLGTGGGTSVLQLVHAFEQASGRPVPVQILERRAGDIAISYADVTRAKAQLGWRATRSVEQMCADTWRWQISQPR